MVVAAGVIRASIPEQGQLLTFARSVQMGPTSELRIDLKAKAVRTASGFLRVGLLVAVFVLLGCLVWTRSKLIVPER